MKLSMRRSFQELDDSYNSNNKSDDTMSHQDIYSTPTASESYDIEENRSVDSDSQRSSDSEGLDLQIPSGYLSPSRKGGHSTSKVRPGLASSIKMTGVNDEDRLLMLAKHPNATEGQVLATLFRKQQMKQARERQKEQQSPQDSDGGQHQHEESQMRFTPAFPVDADTGEAWDGQFKSNHGQSNSGIFITGHSDNSVIGSVETSFDRAWSADTETEQNHPMRQSFLYRLWRQISPRPTASNLPCNREKDESVVSKQEESLCVSITSDKTPKISNIDERARAKRQREETGHLTFRDQMERFQKRIFRTRDGLIILGILLVLLLAIVVTIVAAVVSHSEDSTPSSQSDQMGQQSTGTFFPRPEGDVTTTGFLTSSPTSVQSALQTPFPTSSPYTILPTYSPTLSTIQTTTPSTSPTLKATTVAPTFQSTIRQDTQFPSQTPLQSATSQLTSQPTTRPTLFSSVLTPTAFPVLESQMPSNSSFLDETPLTAVGASLVGSETNQRFGRALALSENGRVLAVGAPFASIDSFAQVGMVQVFEWSDLGGGSWLPRGLPLVGRNSGDQFGSDVALSADGSILVVSEPTYGANAETRSGNVRTFVYKLAANDTEQTGYVDLGQDLSGSEASDYFGMSISLSSDGRRLVVGAPYHDNGGTRRNISGQATVYDFIGDGSSGGSWQLLATFSGTEHLDWFGWKVDLQADGRVLCVGAPRNLEFGGYVECHDLSTNLIIGERIRNGIQPLRYDDNFGHTLKLSSVTGNNTIRLAIGAPGKNSVALDSGMVAVYEYNYLTNQWSIVGSAIFAESPQEDDALGFAVDLHENVLIVGSPGIPRVDRYTLISDEGSLQWEQHPEPLRGALNSTFGYTVEQRGGILAVGSDETTGANTGMVNLYQ